MARSLPDARAIADELTTRQISLSLGGSVYYPTDAVGRLLFNVLAMVAESDPIRLRTREGMKVAKAKGRLKGKQPAGRTSYGVVARATKTHDVPLPQTAQVDLFVRGALTRFRLRSVGLSHAVVPLEGRPEQ